MINTKKLINELNNIKIDLKILELIEELKMDFSTFAFLFSKNIHIEQIV